MLTVKQVAEKLKVTPRWVLKLIEKGKLKAERRETKRYYYLVAEEELEKLQQSINK